MDREKKTYMLDSHGYKLYEHKGNYVDQLDSGIYKAITDDNFNAKLVGLQEIEFNNDELFNLDTPEYKFLLSDLGTFLEEKTEKTYKDHGFLYKRSLLLAGPPGTGKTCLASMIAQRIVNEHQGIVLYDIPVRSLHDLLLKIDNTQKDTIIMFVYEEFDELMNPRAGLEEEFLKILDGQIQRDKVIYTFTTNNLSHVPKRMLRPGRIAHVVEVEHPDAHARRVYLKHKFKGVDKKQLEDMVERTEGFTIDQVKTAALEILCFGYSFDDVIKRIRDQNSKGLNTTDNSIGFK